MGEVTVQELLDHGARVLRRVEGGESLVVTRDGEPVVRVVPLRRRASRVEDLIARRTRLPDVDAAHLRSDLGELLDPGV